MTEPESLSLKERLDKIKSPNLQSQKETAIVLSAIEDTLKDQGHDFTATAYFAALLALLSQAISQVNGIVNKELATSVVYLLDTVVTYVPAPLLRSKFTQILTGVAPALTQKDVEAPLLRHAMGCLERLLLAQDLAAWNLAQTQIGPRGAVAGVLALAVDHRPKVRKRAQEALMKILKNPPPSPALDHPAADMCAETALHTLKDAARTADKRGKNRTALEEETQPGLIHALKLVKTIALASGGWPSRRIDGLVEVLLDLAKSTTEHLVTMSFEVFETIFAGMANEASASKFSRLLQTVTDLRPSKNDSNLLPPWIAVMSRGYDIAAQLDIEETWMKLPELFDLIATFLSSSSYNVRKSASECLISFTVTCVPPRAIRDLSIMDEKVLQKLSKTAIGLLSVKYQGAWMEVFHVLVAMLEAFRWQSSPYLNEAIKIIGELRNNETFAGKAEADAVLGRAIAMAGPESILEILPLNLVHQRANQPGRAWLLPLLRDNVANATLGHFRAELIPLSEAMFQRVLDHGSKEKTMNIKVFETLVSQTWSILPGYCALPRDLAAAFDQEFAELLSNLLYSQVQLRIDICKGLQALVESNQKVVTLEVDEDEEVLLPYRLTKVEAQGNIKHLSQYAANILAVLFNVYSQTLPHHRGYILQCINAYLSITSEEELNKTFENVVTHLETALKEQDSQAQSIKHKQQPSAETMPPTSHTLMDLLITLSVYLPRSSYQKLFSVASLLLSQSQDPQLQKKAYKLVPRLATSETGRLALTERNEELQQLIVSTAASISVPAKRDRLATIAVVIQHMSANSLHFIPCILSEVVISAKEVNEKARTTAFDLLVLMGKKMAQGGTIDQSKVPHMAGNTVGTIKASLEEYFTMVSAGLAGSTPHMISASVTALTRILYEFHSELNATVLQELVSTMDLFLTSKNREVVRSVLGFVKVTIISLSDGIVKLRLPTMIPSLLSWSHEHKNQFRSKVKHVLERAIRRFGYEEIEKYCPEDDKKLIHNIHKTRERKKRKRSNGLMEQDGDEGDISEMANAHNRFESEFDKAVYGSASSGSDESDGDLDSDDVRGRKSKSEHGKASRPKAYIIESGNDPLDLLDKRAFASISSTKPLQVKNGHQRKNKAKVDLDGKLMFNESEDDMMSIDAEANGKESLEQGINAYVQAIRGKDAIQRGRGGRLKFSNRRKHDDLEDNSASEGEDTVMKRSRKSNAKVHSTEQHGRVAKNSRGSRQADRGRGGARGSTSNGTASNGTTRLGVSSKGGRFKVAKQRAQQRGDGIRKGRIEKK